LNWKDIGIVVFGFVVVEVENIVVIMELEVVKFVILDSSL
jgi:hypothetical protein